MSFVGDQTNTALEAATYVDIIVSWASQLAVFDVVTSNHPRSAPPSGLALNVWSDDIDPISGSGLNSTSGRIIYMARCSHDIDTAEPSEKIDPKIDAAMGRFIGMFLNDLELGGNVRSVDVRGIYGATMNLRKGYILDVGERDFRVAELQIPLIVNDIWSENR